MIFRKIYLYYMEILIILIIILFNLLLIKNEYLTNKKKWLNYRLGDIIIGECYRKSWERKYFNSIEKLYPNSIAAIYIKKTNHLKHNRFNNMNILDKIVRDKTTKNNIPGNDKIIAQVKFKIDLIHEYNYVEEENEEDPAIIESSGLELEEETQQREERKSFTKNERPNLGPW